MAAVSRATGPLWAVAAVLLLYAAALTAFSRVTAWPFPLDPIPSLVGLMMTAGLVFMALPWALVRARPTVGALWAMVAVGLLMRLILLGSAPILEIDYFRYLWDGAALAAGLNPFAVAPAEVLAGQAPEAWRALGKAAGPLLEQINYPHLRTIYPTVAQSAFALAHLLEPFGLTALRLVLLAAEGLALGLLLLLLKACARAPLWAALYWWNPLVVKESINSAHMDGLLLPFLLGALLLAARGRAFWASGLLALAAGVKLWPALLLPSVLRPLLGRWHLLIAAGALFAGITALLFWPLLASQLDRGSGLIAYAQSWERNDALFGLIRGAITALLPEHLDAGRLARLVVGIAVVALAFGLNRTAAPDGRTLVARALAVTATLFLLSPTGYPWYFLWIAPLLAIVPVTGLLALTALLPLYYLRFYFEEGDAFQTIVVWFEFTPVFLLLAWAFLLRERPGAAAAAR
ncbi:MAG: glycosyltransferase 87 family protein [Pseudomonadota bacterium]